MRAMFCLCAVWCACLACQAGTVGTATVITQSAPIYRGEKVIATARKGDTLTVVQIKGSWYGVGPARGWIHKKYVEFEKRSTSETQPPKPAEPRATKPTEVREAFPDELRTESIAGRIDGEKLRIREPKGESDKRNVLLGELFRAANALLAKPVAGLTSEDITTLEEIQARSRDLHTGLDDAQIRELGALSQKIRETMAAHAAFAEAFVVPPKSRDQYRNRVSTGIGAGTGLPREIWHKVTGMEFVLVEPGTFQMGSPLPAGAGGPHEGPVHTVRLTKPFYLGKYEVTQSQWKNVTGEEPWKGKSGAGRHPSAPANYLSWKDCQAFVKKLNSQSGALDGGLRFALPTEAEWEYACRAGAEWEYARREEYARRAGTRTVYRFWDVGDWLRIHAWYKGNASDAGKSYPQRVGGKRPNAWRLYDMHGNVWEWCKDWYGSYPKGSVTDPDVDYDPVRALDAGHGYLEYRVFRGGSWHDPAEYCRSTYRNRFSADKQDRRVGCRLAVRLSP